MTVPTAAPLVTAPGSRLGPGGELLRPGPAASAYDWAFWRAATEPDYFRWLNHVTPAAGCSHPVRLAGEVATLDTATGQLLSRVSTQDMPDGVIYKPCGNRRASACPSCADTYRRDAYQLIRAGLVGGKGVPASVAKHPAVFVTLTAPGFGPVHTRRTTRTGKALPCRPRRHPDLCPHGVDLRCHVVHAAGEKALGLPLCLDCYDYAHQVVWNHHAGELWRRTTIAITRAIRRLARSRGIHPKAIRLSYGKVAEMQRRGVVHFHAIVRLDGIHSGDPDAIVPAPPGFGVVDLADAIAHAASSTAFTTAGHPTRPGGWPVGWGEQLDVRAVAIGGDGEVTDGMVAGYLAKYATKSTEATGHLSRRITEETIDLYADPDGTHAERLIEACWILGRPREWRGLRRWAHMLGFGGHFLTKSRRYSVTFRILRNRRVVYRRAQETDVAAEHSEQTTLVLTLLSFVGAGWHTIGDALLANTAAAMAREYARIGREEVAAMS